MIEVPNPGFGEQTGTPERLPFVTYVSPDNRETFFDNLAATLSSGYALSQREIADFRIAHGYSPRTAYANTGGFMQQHFTQDSLALRGISLAVHRVVGVRGRGPVIYSDGNLRPEDTDIDVATSRAMAQYKK